MLSVRKGQEEDLAATFELVMELARYEKGEDQVINTLELMKSDFSKGVFDFFVVEEGNQVIGSAVYYYRYSTWKAKRIYLEDLIVTQAHRGKGAGEMLLQAVMAEGQAKQCSGMMWQVLDWNEPAIEFYRKMGASFDGEWLNCHLDF